MHNSPSLPFADDQTIWAQRLRPKHRRTRVAASCEALLVRDGQPERTLPSGEQRVRGFAQSAPELYLFQTTPLALPLWITTLATADGEAVNLGWMLDVQTVNAAQAWAAWWMHQSTDAIPLPLAQLAAHAADPVQDLLQRYTLSDLRTNADVRRFVAGRLSLLLREPLAGYGLEIAAPPDAQALRFVSDADLAAAEHSRQLAARLLEDGKLQTELNRITNVEVLAMRLADAARARGEELDPTAALAAAADRLADRAPVATNGASPAAPNALPFPGQEPATAAPATPLPVTLSASPHGGAHPILRRLSLLVITSSLLAALGFGAIALLRPDLLDGAAERNRVFGMVVGLAFAGVLVSWLIDQAMRLQAEHSAERILIAAELESDEVHNTHLQLRHILILVGAMLGVGITAATFWWPESVLWLRVISSAVGLLAAGFAIRLDWLHNVNRANYVVADAQRRVAEARLQAAGRRTQHAVMQKNLMGELKLLVRNLAEAGTLAYSALRDRELVRTLAQLQARAEQMQTLAGELPSVAGGDEAERTEFALRAAQINEQMAAATAQAAALTAALDARDGPAARQAGATLATALKSLEAQLLRWQHAATPL